MSGSAGSAQRHKLTQPYARRSCGGTGGGARARTRRGGRTCRRPSRATGTPAPGAFPIPPAHLVELAKRALETDTGVTDESVLAEDFRFEFPVVSQVTIRTTGMHTGTFRFGAAAYSPTGRAICGAPECCSDGFDKQGRITTSTGGYVMDRRVGNTNGLGAAFGILAAIGVAVPRPGSLGWRLARLAAAAGAWRDRLLGGGGAQ
eukprot:scaffold4.g4709.t1